MWLSRTLEEVEAAVEGIGETPGRINKQDELDELLAAIQVFRDTVRLPAGEPAEVDPDLFERMFGERSQSGWTNPG